MEINLPNGIYRARYKHRSHIKYIVAVKDKKSESCVQCTPQSDDDYSYDKDYISSYSNLHTTWGTYELCSHEEASKFMNDAGIKDVHVFLSSEYSIFN
jgi:hypothetical protein